MNSVERLTQDSPLSLGSQNNELIFPSIEWAWMMGALAAGGSISQGHTIGFTVPQEELLAMIKSRGERLFEVNARIYSTTRRSNPMVLFSSTRYAQALGDFTRQSWTTTVLDQHSWIVSSERYAWPFLEGVFEMRGSFFRQDQKRYNYILIGLINRNPANFVSELLVRLGLENPALKRKNNNKYSEGIRGVLIRRKQDLRHFAEHVHSLVPQVEEQLAYYRNLDTAHPLEKVRPTPEDALAEWERIVEQTGHIPSQKELDELRKNRKTKYSSSVYVARFGMTEQGRRSFSLASLKLTALLLADGRHEMLLMPLASAENKKAREGIGKGEF